MIKKIAYGFIAALCVMTGCDSAEKQNNESVETKTAASSEIVLTEPEVTAISYTVDPAKPMVALTFDDGPNTSTTTLVLKILEKHQVPASFFLVGDNINSETEKVVKKAYDMGCEINNHSKTHSYMNTMTPDEIREEVMYVSDKVMEITGEPTKFFRPPFIAVNSDMYDSIDMPFICGITCNDWENNVSVDERVEKVETQVKDGTIILLHDSQGNLKTVNAIDRIIPDLQEQGYQFVTVSELFEAKGIDISPDDSSLYTFVGQ